MAGLLGVATATEVAPLSLDETVRQADAIVLGAATDKQSRWGDASRRWMVTDYTFAVEDVLYTATKGEGIGKTVVLTYWGGNLDGETQTISDMRLPSVGEDWWSCSVRAGGEAALHQSWASTRAFSVFHPKCRVDRHRFAATPAKL